MQAFIISRRDFRENDQIISLYTLERGKLEARARGVKKITSKNSACLEPFFLVDADIIPGKGINHLTKVQAINNYKNIRADLRKILMAGYAMNIIDILFQNEEADMRVFNLIKSWLEFLDKNQIFNNALLFSFILKLTNLLGFRPELDKCVFCGAEKVSGFDLASGVICGGCAAKKPRQNRSVVLSSVADICNLQDFLAKEWDKIGSGNEKVFRIIHQFLEYHTSRKLAYFSGIV